MAGGRHADRQHYPDREDAEGEAGHRPRGEDRVQHPQRGEVQVRFHEEAEVLCIDIPVPADSEGSPYTHTPIYINIYIYKTR